MSWIKIVHECLTPTDLDIRMEHAQSGSIWECDTQGCGRRWRLHVRLGGDCEWKLLSIPQEGP